MKSLFTALVVLIVAGLIVMLGSMVVRKISTPAPQEVKAEPERLKVVSEQFVSGQFIVIFVDTKNGNEYLMSKDGRLTTMTP